MILLRERNNGKYKTLLAIHDEIVLECAKEDAQEVAEILCSYMEEAAAMYCNIPIPAETKISSKWNKQ